MRIFKTKWFDRWLRGTGISDKALVEAAKEIAQGKVEADLGGCLFKKRLARPSGGKSGGYRTIVGYKRPDSRRCVSVAKEQKALSLTAEKLLTATDLVIERLLASGEICEVTHNG